MTLKEKCIRIIKEANKPVKINYVVEALKRDYEVEMKNKKSYSTTIKWALKEYKFHHNDRVYFCYDQKQREKIETNDPFEQGGGIFD